MKTVLIIGGDGVIGSKLVTFLKDFDYCVYYTSKKKSKTSKFCYFLDLEDDASLSELLKIKIDVAIICAGVTSIERCEKKPADSFKINVTNTCKLIDKFVEANTKILYLSSSAVFSNSLYPMKITDQVNPANNYGFHKVAVENYLKLKSSNYSVIRLSKVLSQNPLFLNWIELLKNDKPISPFYDLQISPISLSFVMSVILKIIQLNYVGVMHASSVDNISYAEFCRILAQELKLDEKKIIPISFKEKSLSGLGFIKLNCDELSQLSLIQPFSEHAIMEFVNEYKKTL